MRSPDFSDITDKASSIYRWVEVGYIVFLVLAAIFSCLILIIGNKVQGTLRAAADARIAQVKSDSDKSVREANDRIESASRESNEKIAGLNKQAGALRLEVKKAGGEVAKANAEAARANEAAGKANERAGALEVEAAQQREKAATAEKALLDLQLRVAPRALEPNQIAALIDVLKGVPKKARVRVNCPMGDAESAALANQINDALTLAGWGPQRPVGQLMFSGGVPTGIGLLVRSVTTPISGAVALQRALAAVGLAAIPVERPEMGTEDVELLIGVKPP